jgi:hypothetical protein
MSCPCYFVLTVLSSLSFQANLQTDLSVLFCPIVIPFVMSQMWCPDSTFMDVLPQLSRHGCPGALSLLSCPGHPVLSFLACLYYLACLLRLSYPAVLSRLYCPNCPLPAAPFPFPAALYSFPVVQAVQAVLTRTIFAKTIFSIFRKQILRKFALFSLLFASYFHEKRK